MMRSFGLVLAGTGRAQPIDGAGKTADRRPTALAGAA
jgi:hypothetical protein